MLPLQVRLIQCGQGQTFADSWGHSSSHALAAPVHAQASALPIPCIRRVEPLRFASHRLRPLTPATRRTSAARALQCRASNPTPLSQVCSAPQDSHKHPSTSVAQDLQPNTPEYLQRRASGHPPVWVVSLCRHDRVGWGCSSVTFAERHTNPSRTHAGNSRVRSRRAHRGGIAGRAGVAGTVAGRTEVSRAGGRDGGRVPCFGRNTVSAAQHSVCMTTHTTGQLAWHAHV